MDQMHDACMSAFHSRAWGLEEDVAAHVQWSEAAGKNKLTSDEVNDIRGMLQIRGLLPPPIYVTLCICIDDIPHDMRVHIFTHQYQYRHTNTEGYDYASIMRGDLYALTISKVSTWAVPATRLMETVFRAKSFEKPLILSAQAAGSDCPPGPLSKILHFFGRVFGRAHVHITCTNSLRSGFFGNAKKSEHQRSYGVRGMGPPQGPAFACTVLQGKNLKKSSFVKN